MHEHTKAADNPQPGNFCDLFEALILLIVLGPTLAAMLGELDILIGETSFGLGLVIALGSLQTSRFNLWFGMRLVAAHIAGVVVRLSADLVAASAIARPFSDRIHRD
jgi:hypothetical protein